MSDPSESGSGGLFREEAVRHKAGAAAEGDVLRLPPSWTRWTYWLLLAVALFGVLFLTLGRVRQYASGPGVVRLEGGVTLLAEEAGVVAAIDVHPGDRVTADAPLIRFTDDTEAATYRQALDEFESHLAARLRDPADEGARQELARTRPELERAARRLARRVARAPRDGVVREIRVRPGRVVAAGDLLLSLEPERPRYTVIALLPGSMRPLLVDGARLRVELTGHAHAAAWVDGAVFGDAVIGPGEARRVLGEEIADAVELLGPVVVAEAALVGDALVAGDRRYPLHDGMPARVETPLRSEPLLYALFPALRSTTE